MAYYTQLREAMEALNKQIRLEIARQIAPPPPNAQPVIVMCSSGKHDDTLIMYEGQKRSPDFDRFMDDDTIPKIRFDSVNGHWTFRGFTYHAECVNTREKGRAPRWVMSELTEGPFWRTVLNTHFKTLVSEYFLYDRRSAYRKMQTLLDHGIVPMTLTTDTTAGFIYAYVIV
jgi:hypothetical protein